MAKCHRNNVDSLFLHSTPSASSSSSSTISGSAFRRIIFDAISCGGSSRYKREIREEDDEYSSKSDTIGGDFSKKPETLYDLLNLTKSEIIGIESKKKEETFEILKNVVRDLQMETTEKKVTAASEIRLLTKDNTEARVTFAMLGAIPPLVSMIDDDSSIEDSQMIASLYALLNLGIGNDT